MRCLVTLFAMLLLVPVAGQAQKRHIDENVTYGYAQVLRVAPVYEMVRVRSMGQRCREAGPPPGLQCQPVPVEREERRLAGFDVEYQFKGEKYMSRLPSDPGSRLRVRMSVVPEDGAPGDR